MRAIIILILITIAIALARMLIRDVFKAVGKTMATPKNATGNPDTSDDTGPATTGRLVKDPETGSYFDERTALKTEINGQIYFFESADSRDAFLRKNQS